MPAALTTVVTPTQAILAAALVPHIIAGSVGEDRQQILVRALRIAEDALFEYEEDLGKRLPPPSAATQQEKNVRRAS